MSDSFDSDNGVRDGFTEVTTQSWWDRIMGGFVAALIGLILVPVAVFVLYWNEGRAVEAIRALGRGAAAVVEVSATTLDPAAEGKLVHLSGMLKPGVAAKDPIFGVSGDGVLRLMRRVEMFQWTEEVTTSSQSNVGGSKTTEKTYNYKKTWSENAINSANFNARNGHQNPTMPVASQSFAGGDVRLGVYKVATPLVERLSAFSRLQPTATAPAGYQAAGDGFYRGQSPADPAVGDVRVSFTAVPAQNVSVAAGVSGGTLVPYRDTTGYTIALVAPGDASAANLFRDEAKSEGVLTWILRGVGFLGVLIGFVCMTRPLTMLAAVLPILADIVGIGGFLVALTLSVPITLLTISIAWIVHRPLIGVGLLVAAIAGFALLRWMTPARRAVLAR